MSSYSVAIVGATGAVGQVMLEVLQERNFPVGNLVLLAGERSAGMELDFAGSKVRVERLSESSFKGVDIALFSAGGAVSAQFAPIAAKAGAVVVDNTSHFRLYDDVPLVVPEVNPEQIAMYENRGIIANPNCTTIQLVVAMAPIHERFGIRRLVVDSYQAVSGAGRRAIEELVSTSKAILANEAIPETSIISRPIGFNAVPHIGSFDALGYSQEENKVINETRKILADSGIRVAVTAVRVPVFRSHSMAVHAELESDFTISELMQLWQNAKGVVVSNDYATALEVEGQDEVFVGRIRRDFSVDYGVSLWIVADNLRKGAATNAVQIAEILIEKYL